MISRTLPIALVIAFATVLIAADTKPPTTRPAATKPADKDKTFNTPGGVVVTVTGDSDAQGAKPGDVVWVFYTGRLVDGTVFDSNVGTKPYKVVINESQVIKGWHEGLVGIKFGEKRNLMIPPDLGYAAAGSPPKIGPNATLVFDIECVGIARPTQGQ
jgi:FKBP-type peptidyl-prolyl cis-trans isomerase